MLQGDTDHGTYARVRRNFAILLGGNGIASLLGFAALAFNARALGPEMLGILALLQAFAAILSKLFSFDTWQPVLKFGAEAQAAGDYARLRDVAVLGGLYDLAGVSAATLTGFAVTAFCLPLLGIEEKYQIYTAAFAATLLFGATSSATGLLRLWGRFGVVTGIQVGVSTASVVAATALWWFGAAFSAYVLVYAALAAVQSSAVLAAVAVIWRARCMPSPFSPRLRDRDLQVAFMHFSWSTSAISTINVLRQNADAFVIAAVLGPAATGIYRVASQLASLVSRFGDPLQQALFPEIANLIARGDLARLRRVLSAAFFVSIPLLTIIVSGAVIFGDAAVHLAGGAQYSPAAAPLLWLSLAYGLAVAGFYMRPAVVTLIGPIVHLYTYLVAVVAFIPALYFGTVVFGVAGAGLSQVVFTAVWFGLNGAVIARRLNVTLRDLVNGFRQIVGVAVQLGKAPFAKIFGRYRLCRKVKLITEITWPDRHVWAGYYDLPVMSPDGSRVAYHSWKPGDDSVEFGTFDLRRGEFEALGYTRAWSFQLGTRLQFITDNVVLHYEEQDGKVATCFRRLSDGSVLRRLDGLAYYSISKTHSLITFLNYPQIKKHRKGYGFDCVSSDVEAALILCSLRASEVSVLWRLDIDECADLVRCSSGDETIGKETVHLNHAAFSPDEKNLAFVVASFSTTRRQHLFVVRLDDMTIVSCPLVSASHYCWTSRDEISVFGRDRCGTTGYWYWKLGSDEVHPMGEGWPNFDGHQSRHPSRADVWVTDSYPNRLGYQSLYLLLSGKRQWIGSFYGPLGMAFDKCDLHPRWSLRGDVIAIDTAYSGLRRTLVLDVPV